MEEVRDTGLASMQGQHAGPAAPFHPHLWGADLPAEDINKPPHSHLRTGSQAALVAHSECWRAKWWSVSVGGNPLLVALWSCPCPHLPILVRATDPTE